MTPAADNLPVIVGVGQLTSKVSEVGAAPTPLEMIEAVHCRAAARSASPRTRVERQLIPREPPCRKA
jgi:hypothetical protein